MAVVPQGWGEREDKPRGTRWPKTIMKRVERVAQETGHGDDYTTTLFHLLTWALDEYDRQRGQDDLSKAQAEIDRLKAELSKRAMTGA